MEHLVLAVHAAGPVRTEEFWGRSFRVFPAVLVKEQVLNNNLGATFLPAEEIAKSVDAWNAMPVVVRHPKTRGAPVSARSPEILNSRGAGFLFRARFEDAALKADVFLDMERTAALPDAGDVVNQVDAGQMGELSTGFGTNLEKVAGTFDGQPYEVILRDIRPDHLALLPDEVGACSVADGCGLGVNNAGESMATQTTLPEPPESPAAAAKDTRWQRFLRFFGWRPAANESDDDRRSALTGVLREKYGGEDRFVWVESMDSTAKTVVWSVELQGEGEGAGLFEAPFEIAEDGSITVGEPTKVRRVTAFEPVANTGDHSQEADDMDRKTLIAQLVAAGPLDEEALNKLSDCQLKALATPGAAANAEPQGDGWDKAREYRQKYEALQAQTANAVAAEQGEKARLLDDLLFNVRSLPYSEAEIKDMDIVQLRKVHQLAFPQRADYSLRGGPRAANAGGGFGFVQPIMGGRAGESVLDRKEN